MNISSAYSVGEYKLVHIIYVCNITVKVTKYSFTDFMTMFTVLPTKRLVCVICTQFATRAFSIYECNCQLTFSWKRWSQINLGKILLTHIEFLLNFRPKKVFIFIVEMKIK